MAGLPGSLWVEGTNLHYIDASGVEWSVTGTSQGASVGLPGSIWPTGTTLWYIDASGVGRTAPKIQGASAPSALIGSMWVDNVGVGNRQLRYIGTDNYIWHVTVAVSSVSASPSPSPSVSVSSSVSSSPSIPLPSPSPSVSASPSPSVSASPSVSVSASPSVSPSVSPSSSVSTSVSSSPSPSVSKSPSPSPSISSSPSPSISSSPSSTESASPSAPPNNFPISIDPTSGPRGIEFTLNVYSSGEFSPFSVIYWDGGAVTTTYLNASQITAAVTAGDIVLRLYDVFVIEEGVTSDTAQFQSTA